jgi:hypothetical protein
MSKKAVKRSRARADAKPNGNAGSMLDDFENSLEQAVSEVLNVGQHPSPRKVVDEQLDAAQHKVDEAENETDAAEEGVRRKKAGGK